MQLEAFMVGARIPYEACMEPLELPQLNMKRDPMPDDRCEYSLMSDGIFTHPEADYATSYIHQREKKVVANSGNVVHSDINNSHVPRPIPRPQGIPSENDDGISIVILEKMYKNFNAEVPTGGDHTKMWPTIYRVPQELRRRGESDGYEPVAARIGPFTWNKKSTQKLEKYKWRCLWQLISRHHRASDDVNAELLDLCLKSMKRLEPEIRASYSEDIEDDNDGLALKMLLDGCFILHRLLKHARNDDWTQVFGRVWVWQLVTSDLLLLENQIPFSVLKQLYQLLGKTDNEPDREDALVTGSLELFRALCSHMLQGSAPAKNFPGVPVHHLLHLFYLSIVDRSPSKNKNTKNSSQQAAADFSLLEMELPQWIPCAKELEEAGVRFKKRKNATSFLDIKFDIHSGVLEIPPLRLYDFSDKLFRNLIAFEQTYPDTKCDISTYAVFMDCLINTPEDMRILHLHGILVNQINGQQDASRFFSRICTQVYWPADKNYLKNVMNQVNTYRGSRLHKWRSALVRNYFSNPWVAMSVVAAVLLLAMTILQTAFTVYPYFKPPK